MKVKHRVGKCYCCGKWIFEAFFETSPTRISIECANEDETKALQARFETILDELEKSTSVERIHTFIAQLFDVFGLNVEPVLLSGANPAGPFAGVKPRFG